MIAILILYWKVMREKKRIAYTRVTLAVTIGGRPSRDQRLTNSGSQRRRHKSVSGGGTEKKTNNGETK